MRTAASKLKQPDAAAAIVARAHAAGERVAVAAGSFALLHRPWIEALAAARAGAELLVVIVRDDGTRDTEAILPVEDRALLVAALRDVDHVLAARAEDVPGLLYRLRPDVYVPSESVPGEVEVVRSYGGGIVSPGDPEGETRQLLERLRQ
jgi:bifunctional ADP-heptose synthase (sugar kinase/adenylyltransferase)